MSAVQIQILLSTYNGAAYVMDLLDSLAWQTETRWQLLVRDDGSTDDTLSCVEQWSMQHPACHIVVLADREHVGSTESFNRLLAVSQADYVLFCDQDDVWFPDKIALQVKALIALEAEQGANTPLLVHSDLMVVNAVKQIQAASFWAMRGFNVAQSKEAYCLNNVVSGCAAALNRAAVLLAYPIPVQAMQHDRWVALVCAWFGRVQALPYPLVFYRQHGLNQMGAWRRWHWSLRHHARAWSEQAEAFFLRFEGQLEQDKTFFHALIRLQHLRGWQRRWHVVKHRLYKTTVLDNVALLMLV